MARDGARRKRRKSQRPQLRCIPARTQYGDPQGRARETRRADRGVLQTGERSGGGVAEVAVARSRGFAVSGFWYHPVALLRYHLPAISVLDVLQFDDDVMEELPHRA